MEGDIVLPRNLRNEATKGGKLERAWSGPYTISKVLPKGLYNLKKKKRRYWAENIIWQLKTKDLLSFGTVTPKHEHLERDAFEI